jgi:arsenate reductase (thioredoxin)
MAEGFARKYWANVFDSYSAGIKKHGMNPRAVKVMEEIGIDISQQFSKTTDDLIDVKFDIVVTVCGHAHETCPVFPGGKIVHIGFEDPPFLTKDWEDEEEILNVYRRVRDEIGEVMKNLPDSLGVTL